MNCLKMKMNNIENIKVNVFANKLANKKTKDVTLREWLTTWSEAYQSRIEAIRKANNDGDEEQAKLLKGYLPAITVTGYFESIRNDNMCHHLNPVIAIDIDRKENPHAPADWTYVKQTLMMLPFVFYASLSVRGDGIFLLVAWDTSKDFQRIWANLEKKFYDMGVKIDKSCKNIGRLRFVSYDKDAYLKETDIEPFSDDSVVEVAKLKSTMSGYARCTNNYVDAELIVKAIYRLIELGYQSRDYNEWLKDGFRIASLGESGRELFRMISRNSPSYNNDADVDKKYDHCLRTTRYNTSSLSYYYALLKAHYGQDWRQEILSSLC